jgi:hypothetical protein
MIRTDQVSSLFAALPSVRVLTAHSPLLFAGEFTLSGSTQTQFTKGTFVSGNELRCEVDLDPKGPIIAAYNGNKNAQVSVLPQYSLNKGKEWKDLPGDKPDMIPFKTGLPTGDALMYKYIETAYDARLQTENACESVRRMLCFRILHLFRSLQYNTMLQQCARVPLTTLPLINQPPPPWQLRLTTKDATMA